MCVASELHSTYETILSYNAVGLIEQIIARYRLASLNVKI